MTNDPPPATSWLGKIIAGFVLGTTICAVCVGSAYYFAPKDPNAYLANCLQSNTCRIVRYELVSTGADDQMVVPKDVIDSGKAPKQQETHKDPGTGSEVLRSCVAFAMPDPIPLPPPPDTNDRDTKDPKVLSANVEILMGYIESILDNSASNYARIDAAYVAYRASCGLPVPAPILRNPVAKGKATAAVDKSAELMPVSQSFNPLTSPVDVGLSSPTKR